MDLAKVTLSHHLEIEFGTNDQTYLLILIEIM